MDSADMVKLLTVMFAKGMDDKAVFIVDRIGGAELRELALTALRLLAKSASLG